MHVLHTAARVLSSLIVALQCLIHDRTANDFWICYVQRYAKTKGNYNVNIYADKQGKFDMRPMRILHIYMTSLQCERSNVYQANPFAKQQEA